MKNFFFIALLALAFCGCQNKQSSMSQSSETDNVSQTSNTTDSNTKSHTRANTWEYSKRVDDLSGNVTAVDAVLTSENVIEYASGKTVRLFIGITYGGGTGRIQNHVTIGLTEDKYDICRISDFQGSGFLATFDDGPIDDTWSLVFLDDTRRGLAIHRLDQVADFISKIKQSKKCKIQVNLESIGRRSFEFNTKGLDWNWE